MPCLLARAWADGSFELLNPAWELLGYSEEELAGRCVCELVALDPDAVRAAMQALLTEGVSVEFGLLCKDDREVSYHCIVNSTTSRRPCSSSATDCPQELGLGLLFPARSAHRARPLFLHKP